MEDVEQAFAVIWHVRGRLRRDALLHALAGPATVVAGAFALVLAVGRGSDRWLPARFLAVVIVLSTIAALLRLVRTRTDLTGAARHLDRLTGARERWVTILETGPSNPALACWAARGALRSLGQQTLRELAPVRPPAATVPLLLCGVLVAGLLLLPVAQPTVTGPGMRGTAALDSPAGLSARGAETQGSRGTRGGAGDAAADAAGLTASTDGEAAATARGGETPPADSSPPGPDGSSVATGRDGLPGGGETNRAGTVTGGTAGGTGTPGTGASIGGAPGGSSHAHRSFPVPPRAREAVKRYFEAIGSGVR